MAANIINGSEWYTIACGGHEFRLPVQYQNPVAIGYGAFGAVM